MTDRALGSGENRWYGKVVNVNDPKQQGRVQVRVFGLHDDVARIPDADLPWAAPIIPITHGASLAGVGSSPVGVVPGTVLVGRFADDDKTILYIEGSLQSAGSTVPGQVVDGSYVLNPTNNDMARAARGQDLNSALGGKNLTALAAAGLKFASLSAGVGVLSSIPSNLTSTLLTLDPSNMSGALSGALTGISKIQAIDAFSSVSGLADIGTSSITRVLSTAMSQFGIGSVLSAINAINPASLSPSALTATNGALNSITSTFAAGGPNPLATLSAPAFNPAALSFPQDSPHFASSQALVSQLSSINSMTGFGSLGGIDAMAAVPGGIGLTQSLLSDVAATSVISSLSAGLLNGGGLGLGGSLNSLMNSIQLGGINALFGSSIKSLDQLVALGPSIVPGLSSLTSVISSVSNINSLISDFGGLIQAPNIIQTVLSTMLSSLKLSAGILASQQKSPPLPVPSTTTDSEAATTPAPSPPSPPTPQVGSASQDQLNAALNQNEVSMQQEAVNAQLAAPEAPPPVTESEALGIPPPPENDPNAENENIMKQIGAQEETQQLAALDSRNAIADQVAARAARRGK